jgi:hypothetical protein
MHGHLKVKLTIVLHITLPNMFRRHCAIFRELAIPAKLHKYLNAVSVIRVKTYFNLTGTEYELLEDDAKASKHVGAM